MPGRISSEASIGDQLAARVIVGVGEQRLDRHVDEFRIAVERVAVREGELGAFDLIVDEVRAARIEAVEIETLGERELLQGHQPLRPRARLEHGVAAVVVGDRRLDGRLPFRHVVAGQHAAMAPAGGVHDVLRAAELVDRFRDEALAPRLARALDLGLAVAAVLRLAQDALVGVGDLRIGEMRAGLRHLAAGQIHRRRRRPVFVEQVLDGVDGGADALDQRIAVARIADRGRQHVGDAHRAVVAQQRHPGVERAGNAGREQAGAGDEIEAELVAVMRDGGAGRHRALPADHLGLAAPHVVEDHRHVAARAVEVRLDHLQRERGRAGRIEGVAAALQDAHADGGRDPMGRGDDAEGAFDLGARGERIGIDEIHRCSGAWGADLADLTTVRAGGQPPSARTRPPAITCD